MTDSPVTAFLATPVGGAVGVAGSLLLCGAVLFWARRPGHADRWPVVLSAGATGVIAALLNLTLSATGIWQAASYRLPLIVLGALYLLLPIPLFAVVLVGYRWLSRHTRHPALLYGLILFAVPPLVAVADQLAIERGYLAFGAGYTVWMDALVGVALFGLPVLLYESLRRRMNGRAIGQ